ncbi:MAG: ABC transporter permease [Candidatus Sumerlaeaceae bacterium]
MSHAFPGEAAAPDAGGAMVSFGEEEPPRSYGPLHPVSVWRRLKHDPPALLGGAIVLIIVLLAVFAPLLAPYSPTARDLSRINEAPYWLQKPEGSIGSDPPQQKNIFGRDVRGQDVLSRVVYGARVSLMVGLAVVTIASLIGVSLGCLAGYAGGWADMLVMRLVDVLLAFPFLILALALVSVFPNTTVYHIALVLGLASWPGVARLMRGQVLATRENDYVKAAQALGAGHLSILGRHILPNCIAPVLIWFTMGIAGAVMGEASLSFLGLGEDDSLSWGSMINNGLAKADFPTEWWAVVFPALALAFTVLGFNLLGDGLQDAINPKIKK